MNRFLAVLAALLALTGAAAADTFFVPNFGVNSVSVYDQNGNRGDFTNPNLLGPTGIAIDRSGNLFISTSSNTIEKFSRTGVYLGTFASVGLNNALGLAFDRAGNLYAANFGDGTIEKFSPSGIGTLFANVVRPTGLAFDQAGNLYVANFGNTVERFSPAGVALGTFAGSGLSNPEGLAFDSLGNLYVANSAANTVAKFSPAGSYLGLVAVGLSGPIGLAFDSFGSLYIVNATSFTVTRIDSSGNRSIFATTNFSPTFIAVQMPPTLLNISTRAQILTGENVLDAGFIVTGAGTKNVLIRGLGPSLASSGVAGALANPVLELHNSAGAVLAINDNWQTTQKAEIEATGIPPTDPSEAAIITDLPVGSYTVVESGVQGGTGIGLVEIYDLGTNIGPQLANISTRGLVDTGTNVMIAGFIVGSRTGGSSQVIVRALGPSLGENGVANPLADPVLDLYDANGTLIASNDDWQDDQATLISATGIPPTKEAEAAIVATLLPGSYTAIESGKDGGTGVGLIEVYNLQ